MKSLTSIQKKTKKILKFNPNKIRKITRAKRKLINYKKIYTMDEINIKYKTTFLPEIKLHVFTPIHFNCTRVIIYMKKIQFMLRRMYGNIKDKKYKRLHFWFWKEKKKNWENLPHNYFNFIDSKLFNVLIKAKYFFKWSTIKQLQIQRASLFLINNKYFIINKKDILIKNKDTIFFQNFKLSLNYLLKKPFVFIKKSLLEINLVHLYPFFKNNFILHKIINFINLKRKMYYLLNKNIMVKLLKYKNLNLVNFLF